jgi:hypothetical protein
MYGLRKINKNGKHYGFQWPLEIGAIATAPDWNSKLECGGFHLLPNAQGDYESLEGDYWAVVEFDESKMVMIGNGKAKVPSCKIIHLSEDTTELLNYFKNVKFDSRSAYYWALHIGDREEMKRFITDSEYAYGWTLHIGDREEMKRFITDSEYAYYWAKDIGDREYMKQFVTESKWAYYWAYFIGDREYMKQFVTDSEWAYYWARFIGDRDYMKQFITNPHYKNLFDKL